MKFIEDKDAIREVVFTRIQNMHDLITEITDEQLKKAEKLKRESDKKFKEQTAPVKKAVKSATQRKKESKPKKEIEQPPVQDQEVENKQKSAAGAITATVVFKNNAKLISDILWRFLTPERRKKIDTIFYEELKKNNLFVADLNAKDEEFESILNKKNAPQQTKTVETASYNPDFQDIIMEAILGDIAKSALGLKPQKVKEVQLNAKIIYNNCVLILTIERYLLNVINAFIKQNDIKVNRSRYGDELSFDEDNPEIRNQLINTFSTKYNIAETELKDLINALKTLRYLKKIKGDLSEEDIKDKANANNGIEKLKTSMQKGQYEKLVSDLTKNKLINESVEIKEAELITEVLTTISNFLKQNFKVIDLTGMNQQRFNVYCNYLFTNKQFFIEQTKMLNKYLGTYQSFGNSFYQILADFNTLEDDVKSKLIEATFSDASNFDNLFPVIEKVSKILALTITRDVKKEIDKIMPAAYKAGVKTGEFLGRLVSGNSQTKPINPTDGGTE